MQSKKSFLYLKLPKWSIEIMAVADVKAVFEFTGELPKAALDEFITNYYHRLIDQRQLIDNHIAKQQFEQARAPVHTIKSNSLYIAAKNLSEACLTLESLIDESATDEKITVQWQQTNDEFKKVIAFLKDYLANEAS